MPDERFKYRGLRFHRFSWKVGVLRPKQGWRVFIASIDNGLLPTPENDCGHFGMALDREVSGREEAAEVALERLNRALIVAGEPPLMFSEGDDIVRPRNPEFDL